MSYTINNYNGTFLATVQDGTVDTTTSLSLVGKNYAGYGAIENENFVYLLQNFANTTPPAKSIVGQIWYDSQNQKLKFYDGANFRMASGAEYGTVAPSGLTVGEFWFDTAARQLNVWNGNSFTLVGPATSPALGASAVVPLAVKDNTGGTHSVLELQSGGKVVAIISSETATFTLDSTLNPITDFTDIHPGITLAKSNSTGVSTTNTFWGTASNAAALGGVPAANFIQYGNIKFNQVVGYGNTGFTVGDNVDLSVYFDSTLGMIFEELNGKNFNFVIDGISNKYTPLIITQTGLLPGITNQFTLGTVGSAWNNVYSTTFTGNLTGSVTGNVTGSVTGNHLATDQTVMINGTTKQIGYTGANIVGNLLGSVQGNLNGTASNATQLNSVSPATTATANTIAQRDSSGNIAATGFTGTASNATLLTNLAPSTAATASTIAQRDSSGNISANIFNGTATAARYADLAEKYLADQEYEIGTVVMVGGEQEVTACVFGSRALGVVSENPAFMMNKDLEDGIYIALKGRVPVKVSGAVKKGDRLVAGNNGTATAALIGNADVFAIALESNSSDQVKLIETVVL